MIKFKFANMYVVYGLAVALFVGNPNANAGTATLESSYKWLQGDWGQVHKDGETVDMHGCSLESTTPDLLYMGKLKSQYGINIGYFYHGVISFGIMDENIYVISNFTAPDYMFKEAINNFRKSSFIKLTLTLGVDKRGYATINFDKDIPGITDLRTIVPITNHSFKLVNKTGETNSNAKEFYFTRCDN